MVNATEYEYSDDECEEMLTDIYGEIDVCGYKYDAGRLLKDIDPVAFNCALSEMQPLYVCGECNEHYEEQEDAESCCEEVTE